MSALAEVVAKLTRPGLLGVAGKTAQRKCADALTSYFAALTKKVNKLSLQTLIDSHQDAELGRHAAVIHLTPLVHGKREKLSELLVTHLSRAMLLADRIP